MIMLLEILQAIGEVAIEMDVNSYTEEEKMKISEVRRILAKKQKTAAVEELDKVMSSWNSYSKPSRSLTATQSTETLWEQERKIKKIIDKLSEKDFGRINGRYVRVDHTQDSVIVYLNNSSLQINAVRPTDIGSGAAIVIRDYHIQNVVKGYSRLYATDYEAAINKIADAVAKLA